MDSSPTLDSISPFKIVKISSLSARAVERYLPRLVYRVILPRDKLFYKVVGSSDAFSTTFSSLAPSYLAVLSDDTTWGKILPTVFTDTCSVGLAAADNGELLTLPIVSGAEVAPIVNTHAVRTGDPTVPDAAGSYREL